MRTLTNIDWRLPENRREAFQRSYTFSLTHQNFPGMVYPMLPAIAEHFNLDADGRAWLAWLNGNTQNVVTSYLILEHAPEPKYWSSAIWFWNRNFKTLEWDTDRRHQKAKFGAATEEWFFEHGDRPADGWLAAAEKGWEHAWRHAIGQPYMGRISAWSMYEFAKILLPEIPDVGEWFLKESSSRSHRNALCLLSGYDDAWGWDREQSDIPFMLDLLPQLHDLAEDLLDEAKTRNFGHHMGADPKRTASRIHPHVSRLTLESALCTFKSWHKPNRRYPNVYADMMYGRIKKAEARTGRSLDLLWDIRRDTLPAYLRLEDNWHDPGLCPAKQNHFRETGEIPVLHTLFDDMPMSEFDLKVATGEYGVRKDPRWT